MTCLLKVNKSLDDSKQLGVEGKRNQISSGGRRMTGRIMLHDGLMAFSKAPTYGPHIAMIKCALNKRAQSSGNRGCEALSSICHKEMEEGIVGSRDRTAKAGLLRLLGFTRG